MLERLATVSTLEVRTLVVISGTAEVTIMTITISKMPTARAVKNLLLIFAIIYIHPLSVDDSFLSSR